MNNALNDYEEEEWTPEIIGNYRKMNNGMNQEVEGGDSWLKHHSKRNTRLATRWQRDRELRTKTRSLSRQTDYTNLIQKSKYINS